MQKDINFVDTLHSQKNAELNPKIILFFFIIVCFFVGAFVWAYLAEVDELTRGEGKVIPSEKIKKIQSLDGGLISEILVKEGSIVKKGQALMKIDTTRFQASLEENKQTYYHLLVTQQRLEAESSVDISKDIKKLEYSKELRTNVEEFIQNDRKLFLSRVEELISTSNIFKIQLKQKEQELKELQNDSVQLKKRLKYVKEEYRTINKMVNKGSRSRVDLLKIKKELAKLEGDLQTTYIQIPKAKYAIQEAKNRIIEKTKIFKAQASNELQKINTEIKKYESKIVAQKDKVDKTILHSPVNGIVKQINVNTVGGVIKSGMDLIEIVPQSEILLIEAKIDPKDIAFINPKQKAIVKITAYDFSIYGALEGSITEISADSIIDEKDKNQKSYYKVTIKTNKNYLEKNKERFPIIPGMITSVDIITGKKTILDYILKPILKTKENAMHER
ncbi:HlyD family type I secretion periplasmic adaptor subunit [Arcobacter roscoffensis]|uniref:HlyD family type I secretion periplasmic adaptor subunit n=1 Tax=Arcobacter roscoffensis TaxID=2961520 RepID=A0ABY5E1N2_9BACT|nr:HlyD family type I secretion periplasmic adaptor subunit [Arcobacter roscoffensis]UTJ05782.1 HlyD family type I secretion periplasmic adaptor subunit [Arcobacter roscoffensis]